jgi:lambda repressor-like predicted transcriptional regulator
MQIDKEKIEKRAQDQIVKVPAALNKAIKAKGLSLYAVGVQASLSPRTLGMMMRHEHIPQLKVLAKVCNVLGIKLSDLLKSAGL